MAKSTITRDISCYPTIEQQELIEQLRTAHETVWNLFLDFYDNKIEEIKNIDDVRDGFINTIRATKNTDIRLEAIRILTPNMLAFTVGRAVEQISSQGRNAVKKFDMVNRIGWIHFNGYGIIKSDSHHVWIPILENLQTINSGPKYKDFWKIMNNVYTEDTRWGLYIINKANLFIFGNGGYKLCIYANSKKDIKNNY